MNPEKQVQSEVGGYISTLMREHFGKGPTSVYVSLNSAFLTVHLRGFLAPMEKVLIKQNEQQRVLKTRDFLMNDIREELMEELKKITGLEIAEIREDWNLNTETGMIIAIVNQPIQEESHIWPEGINKEALINRIEKSSNNVEKVPGETEVFWLSNRTVLIKRSKILVGIEKELIRNGFEEELRIAKRPLERKEFESVKLETVLKRKILESFFDWNFDTDVAYMVLILEPEK
ncbi:uncharacterized protein YbcI [Planomicrobium soli]|uniref:Uncharacterized protein YbcI n=1 Tax=Planomicrobium soli TaxID=1176648 RepID=A0A2P8H465_9BACL|nr:Na-translocating system protein MpsC family protein [Planomicrobium soli]PSL40993.1 uncharacterized protein YbcI [Planomicrobium soli]